MRRFSHYILGVILLMSAVAAQATAVTIHEAPIKFMTLADIHFDPFIACYNQSHPCEMIQRLRRASPANWGAILAASETSASTYRQDTNYILLKSALNAAKKQAAKHDARFIIILGDFLAHNYRHYYKKYAGDRSSAGYREFVSKTLQFLTIEVNRTFPDIDVYPVIGNNDTYQYDYASTPRGAFFSDVARIWSPLIKNPANKRAMLTSLPIGGYYAVTAPGGTKLKVILLNSILFATNARGPNISEAAQTELEWLHQVLAQAENDKEMALLAMHIPAGIDVYATLQYRLFRLIELWKQAYVLQFEKELKQFSPVIAGIFAGHLHMDWFQVLTLSNANRVPVTGTPAISPVYGNNPGFKVFTYSPTSREITNFETYYAPMDRQLSWLKEYNFNRVYQPACRLCAVVTAMQSVTPSSLSANYYRHFYAVGTNDQTIEKKWDPYYWCAIRAVAPQAYWQCIG